MRRFEYAEDGSRKFWEIAVERGSVTVRFGRIGTAGRIKARELGSPAAAQKEAEKLIGEKLEKGYSELRSKGAAAGNPNVSTKGANAPRNDFALVKTSFPAVGESTYGELSFTSEPSLVDSFVAGADAERWKQALAGMEWVGEEADGGAVGYWTHDGETVVVYLDNEGSFHASGLRFVDHLSFAARGEDAALRAFCKKNDLQPPMNDAERKALAKKVALPDAVFVALGRSTTRSEPAFAKGVGSAKVAKGPRPLSRTIAGCALADGRLVFFTGEDFGNSHGSPITRGGVFLFDPAATRFEALAPAAPLAAGAIPAFVFPTARGARVIVRPDSDHTDTMLTFEWALGSGKSSKVEATPIRADYGTVARALPDGRILLFGGESSGVAIGDGQTWKELPDIPEARSNDCVVPLGDKLWIVGGEAEDDGSFTATDRTWLFDLGKKKWSEGPALPDVICAQAFAKRDGSVVVLDANGSAWAFENGRFGKKRKLALLEDVNSAHLRVDDGTLISTRWRDGRVVRLNLSTLATEEIATLTLGQASAAPFALPDGRVLFVGGTLFANIEAEPEILTLATGTVAALPGWDADVARQAKALAKDRDKRGY